MNNIEKVLNVARSQLGYTETNENETIYNIAFYGYNQPAHWCAIFIWWVFKTAGLSNLIYNGEKFDGCTQLLKWGIHNGLIRKTPSIGDLAIYDWDNSGDGDHVGIITDVSKWNSSGVFTDIEGNTDNRVMYKTRTAEYVRAFIHIEYSNTEKENEEMIYTDLPLLQFGSTGRTVKIWQAIVGADIDGIFGSQTKQYTIDFQREAFNDPSEYDGIVGKKTWEQGLKSLC